MFNNPGVATKVGALGEQLRFHGVLPDDVRELAVLRFAARQRVGTNGLTTSGRRSSPGSASK